MSTEPNSVVQNRLEKTDLMPGGVYKPSAPTKARVLSNVNVTPHGDDDWHHIVVELGVGDYNYLEGQSLGVIAPGVDEKGKPHKVRLYSIASPRSGEAARPRTAALSVKRVAYDHPETGSRVVGVASHHLCNAEVGAELVVTGPAGKAFVLPANPDVDLLLFATGTGVAPFRAFLQHLFAPPARARGSVTLFYGVRRKPDLAYMNETNRDIEELLGSPGLRVITALSRENPNAPKVYVQHRLLEESDFVWNILERGNFAIYICGIKGMEKGIEESFRSIVSARGGNWDELRDGMKQEGRWNLEVY